MRRRAPCHPVRGAPRVAGSRGANRLKRWAVGGVATAIHLLRNRFVKLRKSAAAAAAAATATPIPRPPPATASLTPPPAVAAAGTPNNPGVLGVVMGLLGALFW